MPKWGVYGGLLMGNRSRIGYRVVRRATVEVVGRYVRLRAFNRRIVLSPGGSRPVRRSTTANWSVTVRR